MLALVQVPEHGDTITSTGSAKGTIGGNGNGVNVTRVSDVVGAKLALGELPDLVDSFSKVNYIVSNDHFGRNHGQLPLEKRERIEIVIEGSSQKFPVEDLSHW